MTRAGGGKGHGAKFTGGQASLLAPQTDAHFGAAGRESNHASRWESLAGSPHVQPGAIPGGMRVSPWAVGRACVLVKVVGGQLPQDLLPGYWAPF